MPLIPERLRSRADVKSAISSQFWEQQVHSTRSIDGVVWALPCEPPALNLVGSSGLSRTQQLLAVQALGVPALPSYDGNSEGVVSVGDHLARASGRGAARAAAAAERRSTHPTSPPAAAQVLELQVLLLMLWLLRRCWHSWC